MRPQRVAVDHMDAGREEVETEIAGPIGRQSTPDLQPVASSLPLAPESVRRLERESLYVIQIVRHVSHA
jgi:hypothetical protein